MVIDAGRTEVEPNTCTCLAIGPHKSSEIDKITGELKLLK
jgi:PTH2 family peptidyl-tRNA hydrolase